MTKQEFLTVAEWIADGVCEYYHELHGWTKQSSPLVPKLDLADAFNWYRRKPSPQYRPWKPEEVPVGALLRNKKKRDADANKMIICSLNGEHVSSGRADWKSLKECFDDAEHSLDHGVTWLPCGVLES